MKIRQGFVSNSSSSSFVIAKGILSQDQIDKLLWVCEMPVGPYSDSWDIVVDEYYVRGFTCMNNSRSDEGGMEDWITKHLLVPPNAIVWEHD